MVNRRINRNTTFSRPSAAIFSRAEGLKSAADTTVVLTGKGFGVTNLVILDSEGAPVVDEQVFVTRGDARSVRIYRRADIQTLSCTPLCESSYKSDAERQSESEMSQ